MQEPPPPDVEIREVWAHNLESELALIRNLIDNFPYVAMDTEFPGVAIRPLLPPSSSLSELNYQTLRTNVDMLRLIQLGLVFSDSNGTLPKVNGRFCIWQFNFKEFDPYTDIHHPDSIQLLETHGVDLSKNRSHGVDSSRFAELLMSSGVVLNDSVVWITFHGGYDFGYLLKTLIARKLPETLAGFTELSKAFFPVTYDVKHLMRYCPQGFHGGLSKLADMLGVERVGICHQAGSDALLTLNCFVVLVDKYLTGSVERFNGVLYGIGDEYSHPIK